MDIAIEFAKEVKRISIKYKLPFFFLTEGASVTKNDGCEAVRIARENHIKWELKNNINPEHEWD